jgi:hypothetical protein
LQVSSASTLASPALMPSPANLGGGQNAADRRWRVFALDRSKSQVCALVEEGIINVKAIDPARGAGCEKITRVTPVDVGGLHVLIGLPLLTSGDCNLSAPDS